MKHIHRFLVICAVVLMVLGMTAPVMAQTPTPPSGQSIEGDQFVVGNTYVLANSQTLNGNLAIAGGTATLDQGSTVNGDIVILGGTLSAAGAINGDLIAIGGVVNLQDSAVISGQVVRIGSLLNTGNAKISGGVQEGWQGDLNLATPTAPGTPIIPAIPATPQTPARQPIALQALWALVQGMALAALATVVTLFLPRPTERVVDTLHSETWISGGVGVLTILAFPVLLAVMIITILLIPFTPIAALALAVAIVYGWIAVGYELGDRMEDLFKAEWAGAVKAGVGTLALTLVVRAIGIIPCMGWTVGVLVALFGLGAVVISRFGSMKFSSKPKPAAEPPAEPPAQTPVA